MKKEIALGLGIALVLMGCSNEEEQAVKEKSKARTVSSVSEDAAVEDPLKEDAQKLEQSIKDGKRVFRIEHGEMLEDQMEMMIDSTKNLPEGTHLDYPPSEHLRLFQKDLREDFPEYQAYFDTLQRAEDLLIKNKFEEAREEIQKAKKLRTQ